MPTPLTPGDGQDLLARYKAARERRDPELAMALFREDAEHRYDPFEPPLVGANAIRERWNEMAASETGVEFDAERVWVSARTVLSSWHAAFTRRSSAERMRQRGFMTFELDAEGLVSRLREWTVERSVGVDGSFREDRDGR